MPLRRRGTQARHLPHHRIYFPEARHVPFEQLVERALAELPAAARPLLDNVAIVIDDEPTPEQRRESGLADDESLYGLYEGIAVTAYGADLVPFPNKITLFRLPLEGDFADPNELAYEVQKTVIHELGHRAGVDEQRLHRLGF